MIPGVTAQSLRHLSAGNMFLINLKWQMPKNEWMSPCCLMLRVKDREERLEDQQAVLWFCVCLFRRRH